MNERSFIDQRRGEEDGFEYRGRSTPSVSATPSAEGGDDDGSGDSTMLFVIIAIVAIAAIAGVAFFFLRKKK